MVTSLPDTLWGEASSDTGAQTSDHVGLSGSPLSSMAELGQAIEGLLWPNERGAGGAATMVSI